MNLLKFEDQDEERNKPEGYEAADQPLDDHLFNEARLERVIKKNRIGLFCCLVSFSLTLAVIWWGHKQGYYQTSVIEEKNTHGYLFIGEAIKFVFGAVSSLVVFSILSIGFLISVAINYIGICNCYDSLQYPPKTTAYLGILLGVVSFALSMFYFPLFGLV